MSRFILLLLSFFVLIFEVAHAQGVAALTVNPAGEQEYDIATGITTLPQGGTVIDRERELQLDARFIRYKDGEFIEATGGTSEGPFGLLQASELRLEVATDIITATGGISLTKDGLSLTADTLTLDLNSSIAVLAGDIKNSEPAFEAAAMVVKLGGGYGVLASPYNYQSAFAQLKQEAPGNQLQLRQIENEDGTFSYAVSSTLDEAVAAELTPYLP
jgi:hypothetical protein